jgi:hypothetical protein
MEQSPVITFITCLVEDYSLLPVVKLCKPVLEVSRVASLVLKLDESAEFLKAEVAQDLDSALVVRTGTTLIGSSSYLQGVL